MVKTMMNKTNTNTNATRHQSTVIKKVSFDTWGGWTGARRSFYLIKVDHTEHTVDFSFVDGADPQEDSVINFLLSDKDVRRELEWAAREYRRKFPVFVKRYEGQSGCRETTLWISKNTRKWAAGQDFRSCEKVAEWYVSCYGKMGNIQEFFAGDLLSMLQALLGKDLARRFSTEKRHLYKYAKKSPIYAQPLEAFSLYEEEHEDWEDEDEFVEEEYED